MRDGKERKTESLCGLRMEPAPECDDYYRLYTCYTKDWTIDMWGFVCLIAIEMSIPQREGKT